MPRAARARPIRIRRPKSRPGVASLPSANRGLHAPEGRSTVWCDLLDLPFEAQSVDLLVMPHTLEFTSDPHRLLREAERVLMPEGRLIILGFNSLSLWGARQSLGKVAGQAVRAGRARHDRVHANQGLDQAARIRP